MECFTQVRENLMGANVVYLIETQFWVEAGDGDGDKVEHEDEENRVVRVISGGGICISPLGLILTVSHIVPPTHVRVQVRTRTNDGFTAAVVVHEIPSIDLCLLPIEMEDERAQFGFFNLEDNMPFDVTETEGIFVWVHQAASSFSVFTSSIYYPLQNVEFPQPPYDQIIANDENDKHYIEAFSRSTTYRTAGGITRKGVDFDFYHLDVRLPLIEAHRFHVQDGSSGCPVFKSHDGSFIGLILFDQAFHDFILPRSFIMHHIVEY